MHFLKNRFNPIFFLLVVCVICKTISEEESVSLQLVHILFRHGDRTNLEFEAYPKDPYINETYYPYGIGELTNDFLRPFSCPNYNEEYMKYIQSEDMVKKFSEYKELFQYLSEETGLNVTMFRDVFRLYFSLKVEEEWGLELPAWTKKVYPLPTRDLAVQEYLISTATSTLRIMTSGYLLQKIITDTNSNIGDVEYLPERKIYLYSAHEVTIATLLATLDIFDRPHIPPYGSYVILEVHKINDVYGIKIFYQNYETPEPKPLKLPACEEFCEFGKFASLIEEYLPTSDTCRN